MSQQHPIRIVVEKKGDCFSGCGTSLAVLVLNEVAVALADLGFEDVARNTGAQLGGVPVEGDIGLEAERLTVYITLFSDQRRAGQAEMGLRAKPEVRDATFEGATAIKTVGRVLYVANGHGGVVDELRLHTEVGLSRGSVDRPLVGW